MNLLLLHLLILQLPSTQLYNHDQYMGLHLLTHTTYKMTWHIKISQGFKILLGKATSCEILSTIFNRNKTAWLHS